VLGLEALERPAGQFAGHEDAGHGISREAIRVKTALIVNAASGSGRTTDAVEACLRQAGAKVAVFELGDERSAAASDAQRLVVAGGDGTVAAVAVAASEAEKPLAVIAAGTANDFARAHGLPRGLRTACVLAGSGRRTRRLELAWMGERPFLNVASSGLAAPAARRAGRWKRALGVAAYGLGAMGAAVMDSRVRSRVYVDGELLYEGDAWQVTVASSGAFGGGSYLNVADASDGFLETVVLEDVPRALLAVRAVGMRTGRVTEQWGVSHRRGQEVRVEVPEGTEFNVDGEVLRHGPASFRVDPAAFDLVVG
jgi:diacylglycerol kinase (ATP)